MQKLLIKLLSPLAEWIVALVRNGKRLPTFAGAIVGAGAGATAAFIMIEWLIPGGLLGGLIGMVTGAGLFPKPKVAEPIRSESEPIGQLIFFWAFEWRETRYITALMDRGIYLADIDEARWLAVVNDLTEGVNPKLLKSELIPFDAIELFQYCGADPFAFQVFYRKGSASTSRCILLGTVEDRKEFLKKLEQQLGAAFDQTEQPVGFLPATMASIIVLILVMMLAIGGMSLSASWRQDPPPPLAHTGKQDELVRLLIWAGPAGVLLVFAVPLVITLLWFLFRALSPPRLTTLKLAMSKVV